MFAFAQQEKDTMSDSEYIGLEGLDLLNASSGELSSEDFSILEGMSPVSLRLLNSACQRICVSKGVEIPHEGAMPYHLFFLKKGKLAIAKHLDSKLKVIGHLLPGNVYGEFGVLRGRPRNASVITVEDSEVLCVEMSAVRQVVDADKGFKDALEGLFRQRLLSNSFIRHPVFRAIPNEARNALARELPVKYYERGAQIFKQGDAPVGVHLILSGDVDISLHKESGSDVLLETRSEPDVLGESCLGGKAMSYSATAASDLDILLLDKEAIRAIQARHASFLSELGPYINKRNEQMQVRFKLTGA